MIKGNLYERNGIYYAVISYYEDGKRKQKSVSTKLPVKGNKRKAIEFLEERADGKSRRGRYFVR